MKIEFSKMKKFQIWVFQHWTIPKWSIFTIFHKFCSKNVAITEKSTLQKNIALASLDQIFLPKFNDMKSASFKQDFDGFEKTYEIL